MACNLTSPFDCCLIDLASSNVSLTYYLRQKVSQAASHFRHLLRLEADIQQDLFVPAFVQALLRMDDCCDDQDLHERSSLSLQIGKIEVLVGSV